MENDQEDGMRVVNTAIAGLILAIDHLSLPARCAANRTGCVLDSERLDLGMTASGFPDESR